MASSDGRTYITHGRKQIMHATITSYTYRRYARQLVSGLGMLALVLAATSGVEAYDRKVYPATMCVREATSGGTLSYDSTGGVLNTHGTSPLRVICPIVRDYITEPWATAWAVVRDKSVNSNVSCTVESKGYAGSLLSAVGASNPLPSTFASNAPYTFEFGSPASEGTAGTFLMRCTIPPNNGAGFSGVFSYGTYELDGTGTDG
jgi:hypothetical protein